MKQKLIITESERFHKIVAAFYEEKNPWQFQLYPGGNAPKDAIRVGNIYIGRVKNIVSAIEAAFVEFQPGVVGYLSLKENTHPFLISSHSKICTGSLLMVQIQKEKIKTKAYMLTTNISFTGSYSVLTYGILTPGVSLKIQEESEKNRLREIARTYATEEYGIVLRTNAAGMNTEVIEKEILFFIEQLERLKQSAIHQTAFSLVWEELPDYLCEIRDRRITELEEIITDQEDIWFQIHQYLQQNQREIPFRLYQDTVLSLNRLYSIEEGLKKALLPQVWLKSGGSIVIQPTEALIAIDVNTGKAITGRKGTEKTFLQINLEAAVEIARQLRLRNLSGIIIIDFIDMKQQKHKSLLLQRLKEELQKDYIQTDLIDMTKLNLVEITRKKVRKPLYEQVKEE